MSPSRLKLLVDVGVGTGVDEGRMVITMDKDFGELVYHSATRHAGVLLLRLDDASGEEKRRVVAAILSAHADRIKDCFCVYQKGKLRIRPRSPAP